MPGTATISWIGNPVLDLAVYSFATGFAILNGTPVRMELSNVPPGALLLACVCNASPASEDFNIVSNPVLTWTKEVDAGGGVNTGNSEIWSAVFTTGGKVQVVASVVASGADDSAGILYAITGNESTLAGAEGTEINGATPSVTVVTTKVNSILFGLTVDFNGQDGSSRTLRDTATETFYHHPSGGITAYAYYKQCTTIASHTLGLSAPAFQAAATAVLEIRNSK